MTLVHCFESLFFDFFTNSSNIIKILFNDLYRMTKNIYTYIISFLLLISMFSWVYSASNAIDFDVTPIKYELDMDPGESASYTATLKNKSTGSFDITTSKSDFEPTNNTWAPRFVRYSELVHPDQQLSTWITLDTASFTIGPDSSYTMNFTIDVPSNATPGWHYGAVFFKKAGNINTWVVWINVDYGILVLVNVSWDINSSGSVDPGTIYIWGRSWSGPFYDKCDWKDTSWSIYDNKCSADESEFIEENVNSQETDDCLVDFTTSNFDGKCFEAPFVAWDEENIDIDDSWEKDDFNVVFDIPFENNGNTHIKPEGGIIVKDEDGNIIKGIGEKLIKNERWAVTGKEIVDYLPMNDEQWNVLPSSTRNFVYEWRGFPYRDINGKIAYRTPGDYYTLKNQQDAGFLMFWERVSTRKQYKTLTADIDFSYTNHLWEEVEFNSAREFKIQYIEQYIWLNPYVILPILMLLLLWIVWWWFILAFKRKVCVNSKCKKKIKKSAKVCPYCETIQNKKKTKTPVKKQKKTKK